VQKLFAAAYSRYGWDSKSAAESANDKAMRRTAIQMLCLANDQKVVAQAVSRFEPYVKDPASNPIPADMRGIVLCQAVKQQGQPAWEAVLKLYRAADMSEEKRRTIKALGKTRDLTLIRRVISIGMSEEVRLGDVPFVFSGLCSHPAGRDACWDYVAQNWTSFETKLSQGGFLITSVLSSLLSGYSDEKKADDFEQFFREHPCHAADRTIKQSLESVRLKARRLAREKGELEQWLLREFKV